MRSGASGNGLARSSSWSTCGALRKRPRKSRAVATSLTQNGRASFALARQCDEAIDAMASFSATDAALVGKELDARLAETSRKVSTRIDLDHNLAVVRGRLGQLNRQVKALERKRQRAKEEVQGLEQQIAARMQDLGLIGDLAKAKQTLAGLE